MIRPAPRPTLFPYTTLFRSRTGLTRFIRPYLSSVNEMKPADLRSEEHTSELQSLTNLVCRLLLEKKKDIANNVWFYVTGGKVLDDVLPLVLTLLVVLLNKLE